LRSEINTHSVVLLMWAGEYLLGWDEQTSDYPKGKMIGVSIVLVIGIAASVVLLHTYCTLSVAFVCHIASFNQSENTQLTLMRACVCARACVCRLVCQAV
jgi:hypothetical protein